MPGKFDYQKGSPCEEDNCKSTLYYEENGLTYCKRGHQQEGVQTQQDDGDLGTQGRKTRVKRERQEKVSQISRGHAANTIFLQAYQLILWKQCYALIHEIGLPAELEGVVQGLWALRLQLVEEKVDVASDETAVFSSQPVSEAETDQDDEGSGRKWKPKGKDLPVLIETLGLLYLGTVLLHLPVSMGDIHRWAVREDIPFIRAVRFIPTVMKQKLPAERLLALDTTTPLQPDHVRKAIHNLSLLYRHHFGLELPRVNAHLILYKHIRDLALPITLYPIVFSMATLLSLDFTFPTPSRHQRISSLPELTLISLLVIAIKLYHPFNNSTHPRHTRSHADLAALAIKWPAWIEASKAHHERLNPPGHLAKGSEMLVTEEDVMEMAKDEKDEYMDYFESTFIDEERAETKNSKELLDMFPTGRRDGSNPAPYSYTDFSKKEQASITEKLASVMGSLEVRPVATQEGGEGETEAKIGDFYKRYRRAEDLEDEAKFFHEKVAEALGVKLETLLVAVGQLERKLIIWREARVKEGVDSDGSDGYDDLIHAQISRTPNQGDGRVK